MGFRVVSWGELSERAREHFPSWRRLAGDAISGEADERQILLWDGA